MKETELSRREFMKSAAMAGSLAFWNPWETITDTADWLWKGTTAAAGWVWDGSKWIWKGTSAGAGWAWDGVQWIWKGTSAGAGWVWDGVQWGANGLVAVPAYVWDRFEPQGSTVYIREEIFPYVAGGTGSAAVTGTMLNTFRQNLSWQDLPPELQTKYRLAGGEWKNVAAAQRLYQQVPPAVRAGGPPAVWRFHAGQDWSHIVPKSMGGDVTQGIWWDSGKNRALGAQPMAWSHIWDAHRLLFHKQVLASMSQTLHASVKGGLAGAAISVIISSLRHGLTYAQGEITQDELYTLVGIQALQTGGIAFALSGAVTFTALLFPAVIPIIAPLTGILFLVGLGTLGFEMTGLARDWWRFLTDKVGVGPRPSSP